LWLVLGALLCFVVAGMQMRRSRAAAVPAPVKQAGPRVGWTLGAEPLRFEPNRGQHPEGRYVATGGDYTISLEQDAATFLLPGVGSEPARVRMTLVGADTRHTLEGRGELPEKRHYFQGSDPKRWRSQVPTFASVVQQDVYPGVDLVYRAHAQRLEYDFVVAPGTNPRGIRVRFEGASTLRLEEGGDLVLETAGGSLRHKRPVIYQDGENGRAPIQGSYVVRSADEIGFRVGSYDATRPLTIDPELVYSTYLTLCRGYEGAPDAAVDAAGNAYVASYQPQVCDKEPAHIRITKFDPSGVRLASAFFGAWYIADAPKGIAVDDAGNVYVTGWSQDSSGRTPELRFPTTSNALQRAHGGGIDAFVTKLTPDLDAILYSTFLGGAGDDVGADVQIGAGGVIYVAGSTTSPNFPTANAVQSNLAGGKDAFVAALDPSGASLVFSSYLGGSADDDVARIAAGSGGLCLAGTTSSADLPVLSPDPTGPFQPAIGGGASDAFIARYSGSGALESLSYLGGTDRDEAFGVDLDASGHAYVTGGTASADFPTANAQQPQLGLPPDGDAFVAKIAPDAASLVYSTYLQVGGAVGPCLERPCGGIAVSPGGEAFVTAQGVFVAKLDAAGGTRLFTFHGHGGQGIARSTAGDLFVAGTSVKTPHPTRYPTLNASVHNNTVFPGSFETTARFAKLTDAPNPAAQFEQNDPRVRYEGAWETDASSHHSGGSAVRSRAAGAKAVIRFEGTGIQVIARRDAAAGWLTASLNGASGGIYGLVPFDLYASPEEPRALLLSWSGLQPRAHTLTLEVAGSHNARSSDDWVWIDGFNVLGAPAPSPTPTPTPTPNPTPTPPVTRIEQDGTAVGSTGAWYTNSLAGHSGGSAVLGAEAGSRTTLTFTGTGVRWIGYRDEWSGIASVYVDGVFSHTVDAYASPAQYQAVLAAIEGLAFGAHTLAIEVLGRQSEVSAGPWIWVDAFDVIGSGPAPSPTAPPTTTPPPTTGRLEENDAAVSYAGGNWYQNGLALHSGGRAVLSMDAGARVSLSFSGSGARFIGYRDEWSGIARVYVDGVLASVVDTYASPAQPQAVVFSIAGLANGPHTLTVEVTNTRSAASGGTWVWVDAFEVSPMPR
jgi:hypothetical protein